jgi:fanconi-associated nuclease 1
VNVTVFRPSLLRRLRALEKKLKVPEVKRVFVERELRKAKVVSFSAVKLEKSSTSLHLGTNLQHLPGEANNDDVRKYFSRISPKVERGSSVAEKENNPEVFHALR